VFDLILYQPEIPPNTGNIIRVCANTGTNLHLVRPLGFALDDRRLRRAGLDYREYAAVQEHESLSACLAQLGNGDRVFALTTRGGHCYAETAFQPGDIFLFGPETRGLPTAVLDDRPEQQRLRIPMQSESRSMNLSNAVAVVIYEAWRQQEFVGGI